ncbi:unnamed protein product [Allacma fusca]|uniref:Uncharacterized protein n=1 Tax=Allacma fusca TaxID=39272 RepID=A0A8J2NWB8_9HEXA|nr:unnamed protein product [Allacma fusca]
MIYSYEQQIRFMPSMRTEHKFFSSTFLLQSTKTAQERLQKINVSYIESCFLKFGFLRSAQTLLHFNTIGTRTNIESSAEEDFMSNGLEEDFASFGLYSFPKSDLDLLKFFSIIELSPCFYLAIAAPPLLESY